jgi:hypothetical protein
MVRVTVWRARLSLQSLTSYNRGVGAAQGVHWFGLIFAMGTLACSTTFGVTLSINYMIDSYHELSGDAMTTVIIVRNTMSFAISYG